MVLAVRFAVWAANWVPKVDGLVNAQVSTVFDSKAHSKHQGWPVEHVAAVEGTAHVTPQVLGEPATHRAEPLPARGAVHTVPHAPQLVGVLKLVH